MDEVAPSQPDGPINPYHSAPAVEPDVVQSGFGLLWLILLVVGLLMTTSGAVIGVFGTFALFAGLVTWTTNLIVWGSLSLLSGIVLAEVGIRLIKAAIAL